MERTNVNHPPLQAPAIEAVLDIWGQAGERHFIPISGNSMLPIIRDGDRALTAHGCASVRRGDVVIFRRNGHMVAHRVMRIRDGGRDGGLTLVTKGDNTPQFDLPLSAGEIVGRVLAVERNGKRMSLDTAVWRVLGWLIATGTLAWSALYDRSRKLKHGLLGPQPNRLTTGLRRSARACFSLILRIAQAVACRWEE